MIQVRIKAYAELQGYNPGKGEDFFWEIQERSTIRDLMKALRLPEHRVMLILKNEKKAKEEDPLSEGDAVFFYPVIGGG